MLRLLVALAAIAPVGVALNDTSPIPGWTRAIGLLTWALAVLPAFLYLGRRPATRRPLPFIETLSFIYGLYYALPIALGDVNRSFQAFVDPASAYDAPMRLAFFGWLAMMGAYGYASRAGAGRPSVTVAWLPSRVETWAIGFLVIGIAMNALRSLIQGGILTSAVFQLFVSFQWLGIALLTVLARRGELSRQGKFILVAGFFLAVGVALSHGNISPVVLLCVAVLLGLSAGKATIEKRWIVAALVAFLAAASLRGIISEFRSTVWLGTAEYSQVGRAALMIRLLENRVEKEGVVGALSGGIAQTAQRSANMDLFADVVKRTPSEIPYWNGETYLSLVGSVIPRFLWPDKPTKELGQAFGHRYGYLHPTNTTTAINLPMLIEFYANFGALAVIPGMLLVGLLYGLLASRLNRPGDSLVFTMVALTLLLPLLVIESDFSLLFGALPLNGLALWSIWILMKRDLEAAGRLRTDMSWRPAAGQGRDSPLISAEQTPPAGSRRIIARPRTAR